MGKWLRDTMCPADGTLHILPPTQARPGGLSPEPAAARRVCRRPLAPPTKAWMRANSDPPAASSRRRHRSSARAEPSRKGHPRSGACPQNGAIAPWCRAARPAAAEAGQVTGQPPARLATISVLADAVSLPRTDATPAPQTVRSRTMAGAHPSHGPRPRIPARAILTPKPALTACGSPAPMYPAGTGHPLRQTDRRPPQAVRHPPALGDCPWATVHRRPCFRRPPRPEWPLSGRTQQRTRAEGHHDSVAQAAEQQRIPRCAKRPHRSRAGKIP